MAIPGVIDIGKVHDGLSDWLKRMDQENLNPKDIFVTLSERDAKSWSQTAAHGRCSTDGRPGDIARWLGVMPFRLAFPANGRQRGRQ